MTIVQPQPVERGSWGQALAEARTQGWDVLDHLFGVDRTPAGIEVIVRLLRSDDAAAQGWWSTLVPDGEALGSLTGIWAGAAFRERELAEMYGVRVTGHPDAVGVDRAALEDGGLPRLLTREGMPPHPLRRDVALDARAQREQPGSRRGRR